MDIRCTPKDYPKLNRLYFRSRLNKEFVSIEEDSNIDVTTIMVKNDAGELVPWTTGRKNVESFIRYGYVRLIRKCPFQPGRCRGEKCQLYQVKHGTGDCVINWQFLGKDMPV